MAQILRSTYVMADTKKIRGKIRGKESILMNKKTGETEEGQDSMHQGFDFLSLV